MLNLEGEDKIIIKMIKNTKKQRIQKKNRLNKSFSATFLMIVGLLIVLFSVQFISADVFSNVIAGWDMNQDSSNSTNLIDVVTGEANGTLVNSPAFVTGIIENATNYSVDSSTKVDINSNKIDFGKNTNLTVSFWVKIYDSSTEMLGKGASGHDFYVFKDSSNAIEWKMYNYTGSITVDLTGTTATLDNGSWHHIVGMFERDTGNVSVWYDGNCEASTISTDIEGINLSDGNLHFGTNAYGDTSTTLNGALDEIYIWNNTLSPDEISSLYNSGNGLTYGGVNASSITSNLVSPLDEETFSDIGANFTASQSSVNANLTNATYYIWNSNGSIFNNTETISISGTSNSTIAFIDNFNLGNYKWNVYVCGENSTSSLCDWADLNRTFFVGASIDSETYNNETYETSPETFELNVTLLSGAILYSAQLYYNNTLYTGTISSLGGNKYSISSTISAPSVSAITSIPFHWILKYDSEGNIIQNITSHTQTVYPLQDIEITSGSCSSGFFNAITYTFADEANLTSLNENIKYNFEFGIAGGNLTSKAIYGEASNQSALRVCVNQTRGNYQLGYGEVEYQTTDYVSRRYYMFEGQNLSNSTTKNYTLYDLKSADSTSFVFEIKNTFLNPYTDKYVGLMRWYPQSNEYKIVEMARTDDDGKTVMKVKTEDVDYRVAVYDLDGNLIKLASPVRMACLVSPCTYTLRIVQDEVNYFEEYDIEDSLTFDEDNNKFLFVWNDPSQNTHEMRLLVTQDTGYQSIVICNTTAEGYTGVLTCDIGNYTGMITAKAYRTASPEKVIASLVHSVRTVMNNAFGLFFSFVGALVGALIGIASPIASIILLVIILIPSVIFGFITFSVFMGIGTLAGIIIYIIKTTK